MLEKLSKEEIEELKKEMRAEGYTITEPKEKNTKVSLLREEAEKLQMGRIFACKEVSDLIYVTADFITDNYVKKWRGGITVKARNAYVPTEKQKEYREVISRILVALKPYYGIVGFRSR